MNKKRHSQRPSEPQVPDRDGRASPAISNHAVDAPSPALMDRIGRWIRQITTPEFTEFKRTQIRYILSNDFTRELVWPNGIEDFEFGNEAKKQHELVMSYLYLNQAIETLSQFEFYFRRYPFSNLPVSREDHARNLCEFYFGQFYTIESRIKEVLKCIKVLGLGDRIDGGGIVGAFQREFRQELRMRGTAVHKEPFDDPDLDRLFVTRVMSASHNPSGKGRDTEHLRHYRKFASTWSK